MLKLFYVLAAIYILMAFLSGFGLVGYWPTVIVCGASLGAFGVAYFAKVIYDSLKKRGR